MTSTIDKFFARKNDNMKSIASVSPLPKLDTPKGPGLPADTQAVVVIIEDEDIPKQVFEILEYVGLWYLIVHAETPVIVCLQNPQSGLKRKRCSDDEKEAHQQAVIAAAAAAEGGEPPADATRCLADKFSSSVDGTEQRLAIIKTLAQGAPPLTKSTHQEETQATVCVDLTSSSPVVQQERPGSMSGLQAPQQEHGTAMDMDHSHAEQEAKQQGSSCANNSSRQETNSDEVEPDTHNTSSSSKQRTGTPVMPAALNDKPKLLEELQVQIEELKEALNLDMLLPSTLATQLDKPEGDRERVQAWADEVRCGWRPFLSRARVCVRACMSVRVCWCARNVLPGSSRAACCTLATTHFTRGVVVVGCASMQLDRF